MKTLLRNASLSCLLWACFDFCGVFCYESYIHFESFNVIFPYKTSFFAHRFSVGEENVQSIMLCPFDYLMSYIFEGYFEGAFIQGNTAKS